MVKRDITIKKTLLGKDVYWRLNIGSSIILLDSKEAMELVNIVSGSEIEIFECGRNEEK